MEVSPALVAEMANIDDLFVQMFGPDHDSVPGPTLPDPALDEVFSEPQAVLVSEVVPPASVFHP